MAETSPYNKNFVKIKDLDKFFLFDDKESKVIFTGETLEVRVPKRFENYDLFESLDTTSFVLIADFIINDMYQASLNFPCYVTSEPSNVSSFTYGKSSYYVLTYCNGDVFIKNRQVIRRSDIIRVIYIEYITRGYIPYWVTYKDMLTLFDHSKDVCGGSIPVNHSITELLAAHLARSPDNKFIQYRHTDMTKPFAFVEMENVSFAPDSTTARLAGSYFGLSLTSALINNTTVSQPYEDLLRGVPVKESGDNDQ